MTKHVASPTCPYCGFPGKTFAAIERHIGQRLKWSAQHVSQANDPGSSTHHNKPESDTVVRLPRQSPSVMIEEVEDEYTTGRRSNPPRRNPNAILEEVDDNIGNSPQRNQYRSVTIKEIEDEDMPHVPHWGPHPFAKPTRPTLFAVPHPNPTAGAALRFYEVDREAPPKYTSVLAEPDVFKEAYWLDNLPICRHDESEYFSLPRTRGWHWNNLKEFEQEINRLPRGPSWFRETIIVTGDQGDEILDLWKRDIIEIIRHLLSDRRFIPHTQYAPERHYDSDTRQNWVYWEMWSGKWWWRIQNILGRYATVVPIILSSNKTKLTVFSGNQKAWPVYITIGNISKDIRRCPSERATFLLGYKLVSNLSNITNARQRSEAGWQVFHTCLESMLEPLKTLAQTGIDILCADGGVRCVFPILAAYIADAPEQATIACIRESCCPICWIPTNKRGDLTAQYPRPDRCRTLDALDDYWNGYSRTINTLGIRPTRPFWVELPFVDVSMCMAPDLLHQLDKGVFGDHMVRWTTVLLTKNEMDRRTKGMPRFQKLRHFAQGTSVISQWTGKEAKALGHTILLIVAGHEKSKLVKAVKSVVDFMARAHKHEVSKRDLEAMKCDILDLDWSKTVFVDENVDALLNHEDRFNDFVKFHALTHYPFLISQLGAPEGFNTEITERLHIDFVKIPWSTTNHVNTTQQMIAYLGNREAWALLCAYMHDSRLVLDPRFEDCGAEAEEDDDGPVDSVDGGNGRGRCGHDEVWQPSPAISIAKRPSVGMAVKGTYLINKHHATDLVPAIINYLRSVAPSRTAYPISHNTIFQVWRRFKLHHRRLPFEPALDPHTDQVCAFNTSRDEEGRILRLGNFDIVLFSPSADAPQRQGLQGLEVGRVHATFALLRHHQALSSEKLVYLERFRPFSAWPSTSTSLYTTQHATQHGRRSAIVVPLSQIRMTCHLAPRYSTLDPDLRVSSSTDLLSAHHSFFLNKHASPWLFSVLDYWEKEHLNNECSVPLSLNARSSLPSRLVVSDMSTSTDPDQFLQFTTPSTLTPRPHLCDTASPACCPSGHLNAPCFATMEPGPPATSQSTTKIALPSHNLTHTCVRQHVHACTTAVASSLPLVLDLPSNPLPAASNPPSPSLPHRSAFPSGLVHQRNHGPYLQSPTERSTKPWRIAHGANLVGDLVDLASDEDGSPARKMDPASLCLPDVRHQRIVESEQRRRDNLRGGFARLKNALPPSYEKCSKAVLLDRATTYISHLEDMLRDIRKEAGSDKSFARSVAFSHQGSMDND